MPEVNQYKTGQKTEEKKERTQLAPIVEAKVQKKSLGKRFKETFICADAREVRADVTERIVIPTIKDLLYDMGTGILEGLIFGGERRSGRRRRRDRDEGSRSGYTDFWKTGSKRDREETNSYSRRRIDLDDILFDKYGGTLDDKDDALAVVKALKNRIQDFDSALVQDVYDLIERSAPDYMATKYGWDSVDELENGYSITKVRGGYVLSLPAPHRLER